LFPGLDVRAQREPDFVGQERCFITYDARGQTDAEMLESGSGNASGTLASIFRPGTQPS
jgi:hypothetical protein